MKPVDGCFVLSFDPILVDDCLAWKVVAVKYNLWLDTVLLKQSDSSHAEIDKPIPQLNMNLNRR